MKQSYASTYTCKTGKCHARHFDEVFKNNVEVIKYCGGVLGMDMVLVDSEFTTIGATWTTATPAKLQDAEDAAWERVLTCAFLIGSNCHQYSKLLEDLKNSYKNNKKVSTYLRVFSIQRGRILK